MSVRLTGEEVFSWAIRACSQRLPWQHPAPRTPRSPSLARGKFDKGLSHVWSTERCRGPLAGRCVNNAVRYYSQGTTLDQAHEVKEKQNAVQPLQSAVLPAVQPVPRPPPEQPVKQVAFGHLLSECGSPVDVLDLLSRYPHTFWRVNPCLMHIWRVVKTMSKEQKQIEVKLMFEHTGFEALLERTTLEADRMRSIDLSRSVLALVKLGVSPRSRAMQILLRVCQERLNDFDLKSLSVLASSLDGMESSASVDALKDGLRLIIVSRLPSIQDVVTLQTLMRHVGKDAPMYLKKKLERKALSMADQFSLPNAQYMVSTLARLGFCSSPLLDICSKRIAEDLHGIPFYRLLDVLMSYQKLHCGDLSLFTAISEYIASTIDMWDNRQVIVFLSAFEVLRFHPAPLMDLFLERLIQNPGALKLNGILSVLKTYSSLNHDLQDHRQQFLDSITDLLESYLPKMSATELLKAVYCLCVLAHFPPAPLDQLLHSQTLEELRTTDAMSPRRLLNKLQTVDLCLRLDRPALPQLSAVRPPVLAPPAPEDQRLKPRLSEILHGIVGDGEALEEGVLVENHYFIDGVITRPLQVTEGTALSEGISEPPEHSQRIAVICPPPWSFCFGTSRPVGKLAVKLRHLKTLGYTPVLVTQDELAEARAEDIKARILLEHQRWNAEPGAEWRPHREGAGV